MAKITFTPVSEINSDLPLTVMFAGGSGTGKTYSAQRLARGMAEEMTGKPGAPFGYVDTENKRALHYAKDFPEMLHFDFGAEVDGEMVGYPPERWIEVIDAAEAAGLPVLVIDSFSHAWDGIGGVLDAQSQILDRLTRGDDSKRNGLSQLAWAQIKPRYRRLIERIIRSNVHIILCVRAKETIRDAKTKKNANKTKIRSETIPWDVVADRDLLFETTVTALFDPKLPGAPVYQVKVADQFKHLFDSRKPVDEEIGRAMVKWSKGMSNAEERKAAFDAARVKAREGAEEFRGYFKALSPTERDIIRPILGECQALAEDADKRAAQDDTEPFEAVDESAE